MSGKYTGSYTKDPSEIFDLKGLDINGIEAKRYLSTLVQASSGDNKMAWIDRDENERTFMIMNQIRRAIELFIGDGTTFQNNGFEVQQHPDSDKRENNFIIKASNSNKMEDASRYYIKGLPATLLKDAILIPDPDASKETIARTKEITPKITSIMSSSDNDFTSQNAENDIIYDASATFPDYGQGRQVIPSIEDTSKRYDILDIGPDGNKMIVDVSNKPDLLHVSGSNKHYRVAPTTPDGSERNDKVYLDLFLDEVSPEEDPNILHQIAQDVENDKTAAEIEGQRRIKLTQNILIREGVDSNPNRELSDRVDQQGNQHLVDELALLDRPDSKDDIDDSEIDDIRNIIRRLDNIGFVNFISNSSFELLDQQGDILDWDLIEINNGAGSVSQNSTEAVIGAEAFELTASTLQDNQDRVRFAQIIGDEPAEDDLEDTFLHQDISFFLNIKASQGDQARLYIRETWQDPSGNVVQPDPYYSDFHSGDGEYEKLNITHFVGREMPSDHELYEIQFGVEIANQKTGTIYGDNAIAVYGEYTESVDFVTNVLSDEIALVRDEVQEARESDIYQATGTDDWDFDSLDARIEHAEDEVVTARQTDVFNDEFESLDQRIENYEDLFFQEHTIDGFHNPAVRSHEYIPVTRFYRTNNDTISSNDSEISYCFNRFTPRIDDDDLNINSSDAQNLQYFDFNTIDPTGCFFATFWGIKVTSSITGGSGTIVVQVGDPWENTWLRQENFGGGKSTTRYFCAREKTPAGSNIGVLDPSDEFELGFEVEIITKDSNANISVNLQAEKVYPGVMVK